MGRSSEDLLLEAYTRVYKGVAAALPSPRGSLPSLPSLLSNCSDGFSPAKVWVVISPRLEMGGGGMGDGGWHDAGGHYSRHSRR